MGLLGRALTTVLALALVHTQHTVEGAYNIGRAITDITGPASEANLMGYAVPGQVRGGREVGGGGAGRGGRQNGGWGRGGGGGGRRGKGGAGCYRLAGQLQTHTRECPPPAFMQT